jgi:hypothetical protein
MRRVVLKSPVLENCTPGSVRGALGNQRPYLAMKKARQEAETLKTANCPKRRDASAVAGLGCQGGLAGKALQLPVFAPLLFISAPPVPLPAR